MYLLLRRLVIPTFIAALLSIAAVSIPASAQEANESQPLPQSTIAYQNYDGLAELVTIICDDVMTKMHGFFGPTVVQVEPFIVFGQFQEYKIPSLGVTLADQMIAMVNNDSLGTVTDNLSAYAFDYKQRVRGSLQEVDGYLRVHVSASNVYGQRISYTTSVEMSAPIYRALHTYL